MGTKDITAEEGLNRNKSKQDRHFFYLDSGKPKEEDYTTVVLLHGQSFHNATFGRLLPLAASRDLRLICPNRRDYTGTTSYSKQELAQLQKGEERDLERFFENRAGELAALLTAVINELHIPGPQSTSSGKVGGLALLGWSAGCLDPLLLLSHFAALPTDVKAKLNIYLKSIILLDPAFTVFGVDPPEGSYFPLYDPDIPPEERGAAFMKWVSSYFIHGDLAKCDVKQLEFKIEDPNRTSTVGSLTKEELSELIDLNPLTRSEMPMFTRGKRLISRKGRAALCSQEVKETWPSLKIFYIQGTSSSGMSVYTSWEVRKWVEESKGIDVQFLMLNNANHFAFWENPECFIEVLKECTA